MSGRLAPVRLALAQIDTRVGDIEGNVRMIQERLAEARDEGAELVLFPELALTGYPPEDLLLKEHFLRAANEALEDLARDAEGIVALVGFPERADDVYNALGVLAGGRVAAIYRKTLLPNYGVFDEQRYFQAGEGGAVLDFGDARIGLTICEDIWSPGPPESDEALAGASLIVNLSASPYHAGKGLERERMIVQRARDNLCAVAFCNLVGGQDELVFDGHSLVVDHEGAVLARGPQFAERLVLASVDLQAAVTARLRDARLRPPVRRSLPEVRYLGALERPERPPVQRVGGEVAPLLSPVAEVYAALTLGVRDYVHKNGFERVVLGLSGGIDSTLVALIAVDALGADRVTCVVMPSPFSSEATQADARTLAANLGVQLLELPIEPAMHAYDGMLEGVFDGGAPGITEENLQARIRGNLLMALSNRFGWLVLTTSNKSENSVGYSTLYGDSAGGFAVIKDVPKTLVYRLVAYRNARDGEPGPVPESIAIRPPSAELRPDQKDTDSLPAYETLDAILEAYVEEDADRTQLELEGLPTEAIERVIALVDRAEYKRRQAPPGIKITPRAFGRDRRMPITNGYRG
ncbi:MAG TPA: NAD+ synthase [Solirubrobacteraceae bacterium]|nr:NAD+ synthase [Solirubrobacteraceae bacterium]